MNEKRYTVLDSHLQDVSRSAIRLSDEEKNRYNEHLRQVQDCILEHMKKDEVFKYLYRSNVYTGSYYENLRISKPDEFDINLVFTLPANYQIIYDNKQPGFVKVKVIALKENLIKKCVNAPNLEKVLKNWIDNSGYLLRTTFMHWMQGVFTKALDEITLQNTMIKRSASGPAFTIKVSQPNIGLSEYSVDLVPVFEFPENDLPSSSVRKLPENIKHKEWTIVPKAAPDMCDPTFWRMSFYKQEREIMNNLYGMKHIIKLMKLFRDHHIWKTLSSYAIKTMFLWECERQQNEEFWKNSVGQLFIHMLQRLSEHLRNQSIPFYWDKKLNLLSKVKEDTLKNMNNRISIVLKQIDTNLQKNPQIIKKYFGCIKESQDINNDISPTNNGVFQESLIDLDFESCTSTENSQAIPASIIDDQKESPFIITTNGEKSHVSIKSNIDGSCGPNTHPEEKINIDIQYKFGCNNVQPVNNIGNIDKTSDLTVTLSAILREQYKINQQLLSLSQQCNEITKKMKEIQNENAYLKKYICNKEQEISIPIQPSAPMYHLSDLQPTKNPYNCMNSSPDIQNHLSVSFSTQQNSNKSSITLSNSNDSLFSELLESLEYK